jgi:hypothetical protein
MSWIDPQSSFWSKSQKPDQSIERRREREIGTQTEWRQNHQPHKTKKTKQKKKEEEVLLDHHHHHHQQGLMTRG